MARLISDILQATEPAFSHEIDRLESLAGRPKIDIRLISEMVGQWQALASQLGLDGRDTAPKELYSALKKKALEDSEKLSRELGISEKDTPEKVVKTCIKHVISQLDGRPAWVLKGSVAKAELKKNPPKKLLKILGLRSVDSAIKREPISQITAFARMAESKTWLDVYASQAARLKNIDFDKKQIEISIVDQKKYERMEKAGHRLGHLVYRHNETAGIIVVPPKQRFTGDVLFFVDTLTREANEIRRYSSFVKYLSVRSDFASWLVSIRARGLDQAATRYFSFGWSPVHNLLHKKAESGGDTVFEPHLDHDDVRLDDHSQDIVWTYGYLLKTQDGDVVSCNISDVILNAANSATLDDASSIHGRRALYGELFSRYLDNNAVLEDFLSSQP